MKTKIKRINEDTWIIGYVERNNNKKIERKLYEVKKPDVDFLYGIIKKSNDWLSYSQVISKIITKKKIHLKEKINMNQMICAFNGGANRTKYYFKYYMYPLLVLEHEKLIERKGRGKVKAIE